MGTEYTFYDYIDADGDGINAINNWLHTDGKDSKAFFDQVILHLEASPPPWMSKYTKMMHDDWKGFIEVRKTGSIQYRLIGKMIGRNIYLVACAIHKDQYFYTTVSARLAIERVKQMVVNPSKYRRYHDYR